MSRQITRRQPAKLSVAAEQQEFVPAEAWLNIGIETESGFVPLQGAGVPVEKLKMASATSNSSEIWQQSAAINNHVVQLIQQKLEGLKAGETVVLNLSVELRKPADKTEVDSKFDLSSIQI